MDTTTALVRATLAAALLAGSAMVGTAAYAGEPGPAGPALRQDTHVTEQGTVEQLYRIRIHAPLDGSS